MSSHEIFQLFTLVRCFDSVLCEGIIMLDNQSSSIRVLRSVKEGAFERQRDVKKSVDEKDFDQKSTFDTFDRGSRFSRIQKVVLMNT